MAGGGQNLGALGALSPTKPVEHQSPWVPLWQVFNPWTGIHLSGNCSRGAGRASCQTPSLQKQHPFLRGRHDRDRIYSLKESWRGLLDTAGTRNVEGSTWLAMWAVGENALRDTDPFAQRGGRRPSRAFNVRISAAAEDQASHLGGIGGLTCLRVDRSTSDRGRHWRGSPGGRGAQRQRMLRHRSAKKGTYGMGRCERIRRPTLLIYPHFWPA